MILADIRSYMQTNPRVTLGELAIHFNTAPDAIQGMMGKWIHKGKVRKSSLEAGCGGGCCKCDPLLTEIYEWLE